MTHTLEREFPLSEKLIYMNHAAVAPWPTRTADAVTRFAEENVHQGAYEYPRWLETEARLRIRAQEIMNAPDTDSIALLKNTSEALSVVAHGLEWQAGDNVVISDQEFPSNRIVWESLGRYGVEVREARLAGADSPEEALRRCCDSRTRLLSISSIQYGSGWRLDLQVLGSHCRENGILFCVDSIQSLGAVPMDVQAIHADFVMADGHKWLLGPEGLALFYCRGAAMEQLQLRQYGWHMTASPTDFDAREWEPASTARRFECGSPNMLAIHALDASLSLLLEVGMEEVERRLLGRTAMLMEGLGKIPGVELITPRDAGRFGGIVTFRHREIPADRLHMALWSGGVVCAQRAGGVRLSPHFHTPEAQIVQVIEMVAALRP